jgi:hypothetical protein
LEAISYKVRPTASSYTGRAELVFQYKSEHFPNTLGSHSLACYLPSLSRPQPPLNVSPHSLSTSSSLDPSQDPPPSPLPTPSPRPTSFQLSSPSRPSPAQPRLLPRHLSPPPPSPPTSSLHLSSSLSTAPAPSSVLLNSKSRPELPSSKRDEIVSSRPLASSSSKRLASRPRRRGKPHLRVEEGLRRMGWTQLGLGRNC